MLDNYIFTALGLDISSLITISGWLVNDDTHSMRKSIWSKGIYRKNSPWKITKTNKFTDEIK